MGNLVGPPPPKTKTGPWLEVLQVPPRLFGADPTDVLTTRFGADPPDFVNTQFLEPTRLIC